MGLRVLVTRPQPGADATSKRLVERGFEPIVLPLTETRALEPKALPDMAAIDAVAVTSASAVRLGPPALLAACRQKPCFVVGNETAAATRKAGLAEPEIGPRDALGLARLVASRLGAGSTVLYLCGKVRLPAFETDLAAAGVKVAAVETYDTVAAGVSVADVAAASGGRPIDAALLHSSESARHLAALVKGAGEILASTRFHCLSPRIAAALEGIAANRITIAARPDEQALLALLGEVCGDTP